MEIRELTTIDEMVSEIETIRELYPNLSVEKYTEMLTEMIPCHYFQVAVFENNVCLGISGYWMSTKLWCGKYLELDNVVVRSEFRSKGIGKLLTEYLEEKAKKAGSTILVLDAYTTNFGAHRFYYNQGFGPKGFHFVKILNEDGIN